MELSKKNAFLTLEKYLKNVNRTKYEHSLRVAEICQALAEKWKPSISEDAIIAGLLHDIGKSVTPQQMLNMCVRNELPLYDFEIFEAPIALHAKISGIIFEKVFDNTDSDRFNAISHAISCHATGDTNMNLLDKIVFISDNIEPSKGNNILTKIKSDKPTFPNEYIKIIIEMKREKAKKKDWEINPLLISTLESLDER